MRSLFILCGSMLVFGCAAHKPVTAPAAPPPVAIAPALPPDGAGPALPPSGAGPEAPPASQPVPELNLTVPRLPGWVEVENSKSGAALHIANDALKAGVTVSLMWTNATPEQTAEFAAHNAWALGAKLSPIEADDQQASLTIDFGRGSWGVITVRREANQKGLMLVFLAKCPAENLPALRADLIRMIECSSVR